MLRKEKETQPEKTAEWGDSMSSDVQREEWMTKELEQKLIDISQDNSLTCTEIQKFASENDIDITKMKSFLDAIGISPANCQGLCS
jgi:hypothetical protein